MKKLEKYLKRIAAEKIEFKLSGQIRFNFLFTFTCERVLPE